MRNFGIAPSECPKTIAGPCQAVAMQWCIEASGVNNSSPEEVEHARRDLEECEQDYGGGYNVSWWDANNPPSKTPSPLLIIGGVLAIVIVLAFSLKG